MSIRTYHDFVLFTYEVEQDEHGQVQSFKVRGFDSPVGQSEQDEAVPDPDSDGSQAGWYDGLHRANDKLEDRLYDRELDKQRELGTQLGKLLLPDHARELLRRSYDWLKADEGLRLRLRLEPQLSALPLGVHLPERQRRSVIAQRVHRPQPAHLHRPPRGPGDPAG
jgi:hypothetical protein